MICSKHHIIIIIIIVVNIIITYFSDFHNMSNDKVKFMPANGNKITLITYERLLPK